MKKQKTDRKTNQSDVRKKNNLFELFSGSSTEKNMQTTNNPPLKITARMARWFYDYNIGQTIWSDGVYEILELNPQKTEANYYSFLEVIHPEDRYLKIKANNDLVKTSKPKEITYRLLFADGRIKWINEICSTDFNQQGNPIRSFGTIQDITKYKATEERLKNKDESLESLIELYPSAILICRGLLIFFANQACSKLLSCKSTRELIGKSILDFIDTDSKADFEKQIEQTGNSGSSNFLETEVLKIDGHSFDARIVLIPAKFKGMDVTHFIINDITTQKQTQIGFRSLQRKYDDLTENLKIFNWAIDLAGNITSVSPILERLLGYRSGELAGLNISRFLTLESFALTIRLIMRKKPSAIATDGRRRRKHILEVLSKNGSKRWIEITANPLYDEQNVTTGFYGTGIDVSLNISTEKKLKEKEFHLKELIATKDKFFAIIAHDLRAPFNSMFGFLDLLESQFEEFTDSEKKTYLKLLKDNISQTFSLLENLLEWSKNQTGAQTFSPELKLLNPIVNQVISNLMSSINYKNLTLNISVPDNLEIYADEHMLSTILHNLLTNAVKYSFENGTISVQAEQKDLFVEIMVADSGIGMDEQTRKSIFKSRETISLPGTANEKGSGLGLILCKEFVEMHEGKIRVESEPNKGSRFQVSIPNQVK